MDHEQAVPQTLDAPPVPGARWNADEAVWEIAARDADSPLRHGESRTFRADGTLLQVRRFVRGVAEGPFTVYHPDGTLARRGAYVAGLISGTCVAYASDQPTTEVLRACCVPEAAWELRARYVRGKPLHELFHDRQGHPLLESGAPRPAPPPGVPATAELDETGARWISGTFDDSGVPVGDFRFWTMTGHLAEERRFRDGARIAEQRYGDDGTLLEASEWGDEDIRHGRFQRCLDETVSPYQDRRVREERGAFDRGHPVGPWSLHDDAGAVVASYDFGPTFDETDVTASPVFRQARETAGWHERSRELRATGRLREALCAAARAAARRGDASALRELLHETTPALLSDVSAARGRKLTDSSTESVGSVLDALVGGADPAAAFRALAGVLDTGDSAALDFVNASLLLAPDRPMTHLTRALIRIDQGDVEGARADATVVASVAPDVAQALLAQMKPRFPTFDFWPARERLDDDGAAPGPQTPAQPIEAVKRVIQVYATRLVRLRAAVRARLATGGDPDWLPPDTSRLLPDGPVDLHRATITVPVESETGDVETEDVVIDEDLPPETIAARSVSELMTVARADWGALTWLCWACSLDRVALPDDVVPPEMFTAAVTMSVARCFRAHDKLLTGGVRALSQGLPSFTWEGFAIDELPGPLVAVVAAEYLELRSMFLWLVLGDSVSPFQDDLREA